MSISRSASVYQDIEDVLARKLPKYGYTVSYKVIQEILSDLFDSVALHVWSREDVLHIAKQQEKPLARKDIDEILSTVERHVDCELGITWQTIEIAVSDFHIEKDDDDWDDEIE